MGTTPTFGFPYPDQTNSVDVADDIAALAQAIDLTLPMFAPLDSPTFVGVPKAPTASSTTNDTQIATTEFVHSQGYITEAEADDRYADANGGTSQDPTFDGTINVPSLATGVVLSDDNNQLTTVPVLGIAKGGTGNAATNAGGVAYVNETNTAFEYTSDGAEGQYLMSTGAATPPVWSDVQSTFYGTVTPTAGTQDGALWVDTSSMSLKVYDSNTGFNVVGGAPNRSVASGSSIQWTDQGSVVEVDSSEGTEANINIPNNTQVAFPIGTIITLIQSGTDRVRVTGEAGVTIRATPLPLTRTQWSTCTLYKRAANEWLVAGDIYL
jgi:hypothetical protein